MLIGITSNDEPLLGFIAKELLPTECLTSLVSMLNEVNNKPRLTGKCLLLLYSLGDYVFCNKMLFYVLFNIKDDL